MIRKIESQPLRLGAIVRMAADALLVNFALAVALLLQFTSSALAADSPAEVRQSLGEYLAKYGANFALITAAVVAVGYYTGMYTRGRSYRARYKVMVVIRTVVLGYLAAGFATYVFPESFGLPVSAFLVAALLTAVLLLAARMYAVVWAKFSSEPAPVRGPVYDEHPRVLVIGGAGYIGSALIPKLLERGYRVRLLDMFLYGKDPIEAFIAHPRLETIEADFRQVDRVVEAMMDVESVIHLGAIVGDPACALDEELTLEVNLMATRMIAEVAKGRGIKRFVFASTCSVYGASDAELNESSALNPVSLYAKSKIASEKVLLGMADDRFAPTILRFGTIYGLSGRTRFDLVVNLLTAKAIVEGKITVFGPDQWRPFVHVDDAAKAVFLALEAPLSVVGKETFNVGSECQNYTLGQVGETIKRLVPTAEMIITGTDGDRRNYRVNFAKITERLAFEPGWTLEAGIRQVMEALAHGEVQDYQDAKYSNVKYLSEADVAFAPNNGWAYALIEDASEPTKRELIGA